MSAQNTKLVGIYNKCQQYLSEMYWPYRFCDEPQIYSFNLAGKDLKKHSDGIYQPGEPTAAGSSFNLERAINKTIGEGIERYCCSAYRKKDFQVGTRSQVFNAVDPVIFSKYTRSAVKKNIQLQVAAEDTFAWKNATRLHDSAKVYIPAQLVYTNYLYQKNEKIIQLPNSNGAAAGFSTEEALGKGILELIEREAYLIYYLNRISPQRIKKTSIKNSEIQSMLKKCSQYNLDVHILDITTDFGIPIYMTMMTDPTLVGAPVSTGAKASLSSDAAIIGSIEEALQVRNWIRYLYETNKKKLTVNNKSEIRSIKQRGIYWYNSKLLPALDFYLRNPKTTDYTPITLGDQNSLGEIKKRIKQRSISIYYTDVTLPDIRKLGFHVVKVLSPDLMPIYFKEEFTCFNCDRLYTVPVALGYKSKRLNEKALNPIPHNFL